MEANCCDSNPCSDTWYNQTDNTCHLTISGQTYQGKNITMEAIAGNTTSIVDSYPTWPTIAIIDAGLLILMCYILIPEKKVKK